MLTPTQWFCEPGAGGGVGGPGGGVGGTGVGVAGVGGGGVGMTGVGGVGPAAGHHVPSGSTQFCGVQFCVSHVPLASPWQHAPGAPCGGQLAQGHVASLVKASDANRTAL